MIRNIFAVLVFASSVVLGQHPEVNSKDSWMDGLKPKGGSLSFSYRSQYVFSNDLAVHDGPVAQADLFLITDCGLTLDLWASLPMDIGEFNDDFGTEFDFSIGKNWKVGDYNLSTSVAYYDLCKVGSIEGGDCIAVRAEISRDFTIAQNFIVSPFFKTEVNFAPGGATCGDTLPRAGLRTSWKMDGLLTLTSQTMLLYDPGIFGGKVAWVADAQASLLWKLSDRMTLELPYVEVIDAIAGGSDRDMEFVGGAKIIIAF